MAKDPINEWVDGEDERPQVEDTGDGEYYVGQSARLSQVDLEPTDGGARRETELTS
jgi:hypothetical protein